MSLAGRSGGQARTYEYFMFINFVTTVNQTEVEAEIETCGTDFVSQVS